MKTSRTGIHLVSVSLLLLWSAVLLYFYGSGRLEHYLPPDGIFRPMVLVSGIGLAVLALFNLATMGTKEADCCSEAHVSEYDREAIAGGPISDGHKHDHADGGCCGHDHSHDHDHGHEHKHEVVAAKAHDHAGCCGHDHTHDHGHGHAHSHSHDHDHDHAGHAHGILDESGPLGRIIAIMILAVPVTYAAVKTPDNFSQHAVQNKGLYSQNYGSGARAEQFSLKKDTGANMTSPAAVAAVGSPAGDAQVAASVDAPPTGHGSADPSVAVTTADNLPAANPKEIEKQAAKTGAEAKSFGSFTLEDLKAQVPQNAEGSFILEVPEIYYTAGDKEVQGVLSGQSVETIAQVLPEKVNNPNGTRVRIFRMLVQCCAADARPYSIPVEFGKEPPKFKDMAWVKVTGKMTFKQEGTQTVPVLEAVTMVESTEPDNKMVY